MSNVVPIAKLDRQSDEYAERTITVLEKLIGLIRERRLHGLVVVGLERVTDDVGVEAEVHRAYLAPSVLDALALTGASILVIDEIKAWVTGETMG